MRGERMWWITAAYWWNLGLLTFSHLLVFVAGAFSHHTVCVSWCCVQNTHQLEAGNLGMRLAASPLGHQIRISGNVLGEWSWQWRMDLSSFPSSICCPVHCNKQLSAGTLGVELCSGHSCSGYSCSGSCSECWQAGVDSVDIHPSLMPKPHAS